MLHPAKKKGTPCSNFIGNTRRRQHETKLASPAFLGNCHSPLSDLDHILAILWIVFPSLSTWKARKEPKREKEKWDLAWTQKVSQDIHRTLVVDYEAKDTDREVGGDDDDQGIIGVGGYRR